MQGIILTEKDRSGPLGQRRWIFVPQAHIQFQALPNGQKKMIVIAFRTDNLHAYGGGYTPTEDYLRLTCHFGKTVEVDDDIVDFAVESERQRQAEVSMTEKAFMAAEETGDADIGLADYLVGLQNFAGNEEQEHQIGKRIWQILPNPHDNVAYE